MFTFGHTSGTSHDVLLRFVGAVYHSLEVDRLGVSYMNAIQALLPASGYGFYLLNGQKNRPTRVATRGTVERFVRRYEEDGHTCDPLLHHMEKTREPIHEGALFTQKQWQTHPFREVLQMRRLAHIAGAPLIVDSKPAGMLYFTRPPDDPPFADRDIEILRVIAEHTSLALTHALRYAEACRRSAVVEEALHLVDTAVVLSDTQGTIKFANRQAQAFAGLENGRHSHDERFQSALDGNLTRLTRSGEDVAVNVLPSGKHGGTAAAGIVLRSVRLPAVCHAVATFLYEERDRLSFEHLDTLLSRREVEVLKLIAQGLQNKQIAERLFISTNTVKFHLKHMFRTMQVNCRSELLAKAYQYPQSPTASN